MRKNLFLFVLAFIGIAGTVFGQTPATLPYNCDFESPGDNGWTLKNGTCTNQWHVGAFSSPAGHSGSLFLSADSGLTASYDISKPSVVVAEKIFQTGTSDSLQISFDLTIGGESNCDYLKVFWVPVDTNYEASTNSTVYYAKDDYAPNVIMSNATNAYYRFVYNLQGTQRMTAAIANEPNSLKKLVFVWRNDRNLGTQPGAIIDNISIEQYCPAVTDLSASNITGTSAEISWNGSATDYEVRLNGGAAETVTNTSKTFTDLTNGTEYTVEVRAVCGDNYSEWDTVRFTTLCSSVSDLAVSNITETSAEVNWNGSASNYEVRLNGGDVETVSTTSKTFTDLTNGTEYTVEVRAVCEHNESEWDTVRFTTASSSGLEQVAAKMEVLIYPNPAKDKAVLSLSGLTEDARLIVSDIQGKIVMSDNIAKGSENYDLDLKGFASGVYSVTIVSGNNKTTQKLIVE